MSDGDREIMEFFTRYSPMMVPMGIRQGATKSDAEDAASAVIICIIDGAVWDLEHAGVNAAGASGHYGVPITVSRWEHSLISQHKLCCAAVPIHLPQGRSVTINLTSSSSSMTSVPRAVFLQLLDLARRLRREEWKSVRLARRGRSRAT